MNYNNISNDWDQQLRDAMLAELEEKALQMMCEYVEGEKVVDEMLMQTLAS